jgi:hypothetical protein
MTEIGMSASLHHRTSACKVTRNLDLFGVDLFVVESVTVQAYILLLVAHSQQPKYPDYKKHLILDTFCSMKLQL